MDSLREGTLNSFPLGSYLLHADWTARLFREGKGAISRNLEGILERLGASADLWQRRLEKLRSGRLWGRFFASRRERLREGAPHLANLSACPAP